MASKSTNVSNAADTGDEQKQTELNTALQEFTSEAAAGPQNDQADW
jgi:hypothetical protein